jgi:hypothetical protein
MSTRSTIVSGLFLILLAVSIFFFFYATPKVEPIVEETSQQTTTTTYTNTEHGFSVTYPKTFIIDTLYGYQGFGPQETIKGTSFTVPPSVATGTNLSSDSYLSIEYIPKVTTCKAESFLDFANGAKAYTVIDNGVTYVTASSTGAGVGNRYEETVYILSGKSTCYGIRYFIHYSVLENYPVGLVKEFDKQSLLMSFDTIRRSLVITQ